MSGRAVSESGAVAACSSVSAMQPESGRPDASDPAPAPPIDLDYLRRYTFGDETLEREVLELFSAHAPALLAEIRSARNEVSRRNAAHSLKGSALAIGAWDVARRAEQLEACVARHGEADGILEQLEIAVGKARRFIAAWSGDRLVQATAPALSAEPPRKIELRR